MTPTPTPNLRQRLAALPPETQLTIDQLVVLIKESQHTGQLVLDCNRGEILGFEGGRPIRYALRRAVRPGPVQMGDLTTGTEVAHTRSV